MKSHTNMCIGFSEVRINHGGCPRLLKVTRSVTMRRGALRMKGGKKWRDVRNGYEEERLDEEGRYDEEGH